MRKESLLLRLRFIGVLVLALSLVSPGQLAFTAPQGKDKEPKTKREVIWVSNVEEFVKKNNIEIPDSAKVVGAVIIRYKENETEPPTNFGDIQIQWGIPYYYITNVRTSETCGIELLRKSYAKGPATLSMTIKESVSAKWGTNTGISASTVSASLGFDVTKAYEITDSISIQVPAGKTYALAAYPMYRVYNFAVYHNPMIGSAYYAGDGWAWKPSGVCFVWYQV